VISVNWEVRDTPMFEAFAGLLVVPRMMSYPRMGPLVSFQFRKTLPQ
jgi:hypothetical protein